MRLTTLGSLALVLLAGCGDSDPPHPPLQPADFRGTVDASLPPAQREKQTVLKRTLDELQGGTSYDSLKEYHRNVKLTETRADFLAGTIGLARWDFNGPATGNDVPVLLYLLEDGPLNPERKVERVYTVTGDSQGFTIRRKS